MVWMLSFQVGSCLCFMINPICQFHFVRRWRLHAPLSLFYIFIRFLWYFLCLGFFVLRRPFVENFELGGIYNDIIFYGIFYEPFNTKAQLSMNNNCPR